MNLFTQKQIDTANELLQLLNEDLKEKEKYKPIACFTEKGYDIYVCGRNVEKDKIEMLFNILDFKGKTPKGFCVNWRIFSHIKQELGI